MGCKHTRDWKKDTCKRVNCSDNIVLRCHPSHFQQCYDAKLTCNVNKV